jgi:CheY-like chemotaxis protein
MVVPVVNRKDAMQKLRDWTINLIITDLFLPDETGEPMLGEGEKLVQELKSGNLPPHDYATDLSSVPIVVVSGDESGRRLIQNMEIKNVYTFSKPIDHDLVMDHVSELLK